MTRNAIKNDLFSHDQRRQKLDDLGDPLQALEAHVDFAALAAEVDRVAPREVNPKGGRPPYPTETMVRILMLKRLHNLSDEQMEYQLLDRMSFQRFCGLSFSRTVPDRTTLWSFENRIGAEGAQAIFQAMKRQLERKGYIARCGQLIDATVVQAPTQRNTRQENEQIKAGKVPEDWSKAKRAQKDVDATWTKKHGKSYFGYKLSINADNRHKVIQRIVTDTASTHDSQHFEDLVDPSNTSRDLYADRAFPSKERDEWLRQHGYRHQIQRKGTAQKPLSDCQKRRNRRIAKTRARVEHVFASLEQMGGKFIRTIGLARATFAMTMMAACYNAKRLVSLHKSGIAPF